MLQTLAALAKEHPDKTKVLLGCTDDYAAMIIRNRAALAKDYIVPYINTELMEHLVSKESFYQYCDRFGIPYPGTVILRKEDGQDKLENLPFAYPIIIKPSSSIEYWKYPFDGMKTVHYTHLTLPDTHPL